MSLQTEYCESHVSDTEFAAYPALLLSFLKIKIKEKVFSSHIDLLI